MRLFYSLMWWLALPLVLTRLWLRGRQEPGYRQHWGERLGFYPRASAAAGQPQWASDERFALLMLSPNQQAIVLHRGGDQETLFTTSDVIAKVSFCPLSGVVAALTSSRELLVYAVPQRLLQLPGVRGVRVKIAKLEIFDDCEVAIRVETGQW